MDSEITAHEERIKRLLAVNKKETDWIYWVKYNHRKIQYFQMERLHHLLVTLSVGLFSLISIYFAYIIRQLIFVLVSIILLVLFVPYIFHYYKLENGVQRLYKLGDELESKLHNTL